MKIGILGTGFGSYHAKIYNAIEGAQLVKMFGRNEEKLRQKGEEFTVAVTQNIYDIINDPNIDIVDICLPTKEHAHYIIEAFKAGKHVFCETPLCYNNEEMFYIKKAEQEYGKCVFVDLFVKFIAEYQYLYEVLQNNTYGKLKALTLTRKTPPIWGPLGLGAIIKDLMLHDLDLAVWYLGMPISKSVTGISGRQGESLVKAILQYENSFIEIEASSMMPESYPFTVGYEAIFENGVVEYREAFTDKGNIKYCTEYTSDGKQELKMEGHDPYEYAIRHVIDCCTQGKENIIDSVSAANSLKIASELQDMLRKDWNL